MILFECRGADLPLGIERRCIACRELVQGLDGILRLRWTRAIGRRSVLRQANMVLLRRVEGVDGGQRGLALVGG